MTDRLATILANQPPSAALIPGPAPAMDDGRVLGQTDFCPTVAPGHSRSSGWALGTAIAVVAHVAAALPTPSAINNDPDENAAVGSARALATSDECQRVEARARPAAPTDQPATQGKTSPPPRRSARPHSQSRGYSALSETQRSELMTFAEALADLCVDHYLAGRLPLPNAGPST